MRHRGILRRGRLILNEEKQILKTNGKDLDKGGGTEAMMDGMKRCITGRWMEEVEEKKLREKRKVHEITQNRKKKGVFDGMKAK